ncbi:MAG: ornithine cyclodeaminase family protein [Clostridia bacterium]|nr:ornithine cyclodeaminase family protein [Clostridia bacterium]
MDRSLVITNAQVQAHVTLEEAIECVEDTWRWHGEGEVVMPPKITTDMSEKGIPNWFNSMPSYIHPLDMAGIKVVGGYLENPKHGLPFIRSNLMLLDPHNGRLRALMCGDWISDARTGAQPAIAMKYLAARTDVLTVIGAGQQAYYCVSCIARLHHIRQLRVCDIRPEARARFAARFPEADFEIVQCATNREGCEGADVIITITTANAPLVEEAWCKPGCLVLTMGSFTETADDVALRFDKLFIDHAAQGLHRGNFKEMADRGIVTRDSIEAELPAVVCGRHPGRTNPEDRILCELVGMGSPDLCIATRVYRALLKEGCQGVLSIDMMGEE